VPEPPTARVTLGDVAGSRSNSFDALRLGAAVLVLVSHSFALTAHGEPRIGSTSLGVVGVEIFFAISGFLVVRSWLGQPWLPAFLLKRTLRIMPALVVCVLLSAYLVGLLVTSRAWSDFFGSTEPLRYVLENTLAVASAGTLADIQYELPGVFATNPHHAVNGSLWTLPIEVRAYYLLALLGVLGLLRRVLPLAVAAGLAGLAVMALGDTWPSLGAELGRFRHHEEPLLLLTLFAASALLYLWRERVPLHAGFAGAAFCAWLGLSWTVVSGPATVLLLPYVVLFAAYRAPARVRLLTARGDVSYGVYLFAFPVQQVLVRLLGPELEPWALAAISLLIVYVLALLSWRLLESPALRLKRRLRAPDRTYPIGQDGAVRPSPQST